MSMSIDDVMRKLDELVDESMLVQQGLLKLRLRRTPKKREQQQQEQEATPNTELAAQ